MDLADREFNGQDFRDHDLTRLRTERVVFVECDFSGANLAESEHKASAFRNCLFRRTTLWHSVFRQCSLLGSVFTECRLRPLTLDEVDFTLAVLGGCDLRDVDLSGCRLRETSLVEVDMRKAVLTGADLRGARTIGARLEEADLRGAVADPSLWTTATLSGARIDVAQALAYAGRAWPRHTRRVGRYAHTTGIRRVAGGESSLSTVVLPVDGGAGLSGVSIVSGYVFGCRRAGRCGL